MQGDPPIRLPFFFVPTDPFLPRYATSPSLPTPFVPAPDASGMSSFTLADNRKVGVRVRHLTLSEDFDENGRLIQYLGTNVEPIAGKGFGRTYMSEPTEVVRAGSYEIWEIANLTGDTNSY